MGKGKHKSKRERAQQQAQKQAENIQTLNTEVVASKDEAAAAKSSDDRANKEEPKMGLREMLKRPSVTDWCIMAFTGILAAAAIYQFRIMSSQLREAQTQTRLSVRPFIGPDDEGANPIANGLLHVDENGNALMQYTIRAKNYSNVPATNVFSYANLVIADDLNVAYEQQSEACGDGRIGKPDIGYTLFQGRGRVFIGFPALSKVTVRHEQTATTHTQFSVWLAGCIGYRDQFGYLYRTKLLYGMVDAKDDLIHWIGPPKGPIDVTGTFRAMSGGGVDAGQIPKYN